MPQADENSGHPPAVTARGRALTLSRKLLFALVATLGFFVLTEGTLHVIAAVVHSVRVTKLNPSLNPRVDGDGVLRLMTLGDSLTAGQGTAPQYAYPRQLERLLQDLNPEQRSEVINLGVFALNTSRLVDLLPGWLEEYRPDVVVVLSGCNNSWNYMNSHLGDLGMLDRPLLQQLLDQTKTYRFLRLTLRRKKGPISIVRAPVQPTRLSSLPTDMQVLVDETAATHEGQPEMFVDEGALIELFKYDLALILEHTRASGAELIVLTYPFEVNGFEHRDELLRWGRENGVVVADVQERFADLEDDRPEIDPFSADRGHPNALGYGVVATEVYRQMAAHSRLPGGRALAPAPDPVANPPNDVAYLEEAHARLLASLERTPNNFRVWETRGNIEVELERWADAEHSFRRAFELSRAGPQYVEALSWLYGMRGDEDDIRWLRSGVARLQSHRSDIDDLLDIIEERGTRMIEKRRRGEAPATPGMLLTVTGSARGR